MSDPQKSTAIVTGAGSGIGRASTLKFLHQGWNVVAVDREAQRLDALYTEDGVIRRTLRTLTVDVLETRASEEVFDAAREEFGSVQCLVNNAGKGNARGATETSDADWDAFLDLNLGSVFRFSRLAVDRLTSAGSIVNIASVHGMTGFRNNAPYSAAKAGVIGLTRQMAADYGRKGIRINAIAPGVIATAGNAPRRADQWFIKASVETSPLGRVGEPEEVAEAVFFLGSPAASYISGVVLPVDAGWTGTRYYPDL